MNNSTNNNKVLNEKHTDAQQYVNRKLRFLLLAIAFFIIIADQLTKFAARSNLTLAKFKIFLPFWNWALAYNRGAAFSFLDSSSTIWPQLLFGAVAVFVAITLVYYLLNRYYSILLGFALCFILGGAVGNLIDRLIFGRVTDFIDWYYRTYHWPTFNLADSFVTVGVGLILIDAIWQKKK